MFDHFTPDLISTLDGIQKIDAQADKAAIESMRNAIAAFKRSADDFAQRAPRAVDALEREQLRTLAQGFAAAATVCDRVIAS